MRNVQHRVIEETIYSEAASSGARTAESCAPAALAVSEGVQQDQGTCGVATPAFPRSHETDPNRCRATARCF